MSINIKQKMKVRIVCCYELKKRHVGRQPTKLSNQKQCIRLDSS
jgi:hypothetical protein